MMKSNYDVGERIRSLRQQKQLSQEQVALKAEITPAYLGQIERGEKNPTLKAIEKLCDALNVTLVELFSNQNITSANDVLMEQIICEVKDCSDAEKKEILNIIRHTLKLKKLN